MFRTMAAACLAACAMLGAAGSAQAAALIYEGSGTFVGELSGAPVSVAVSFQLMHHFDPASVIFDPISEQSYYRGGSVYGQPLLSTGNLIIDDRHMSFTADYYSQILQAHDGVHYTAGAPGLFSVTVGTNFAPGSLVPDLAAPPSGNLCLIAISCGGTIYFGEVNGGLELDNLTVTYHPWPGNTPAPEPTTWALMITGFGGAGAMLRRRRLALS